MKTSGWTRPGTLAIAVATLGIVFSGNSVLAQTTEAQQPANMQYWNQFHGPNGSSKAIAANLPVEFSDAHNIRWKTAIHDKGWSSPVVWGDQMIVDGLVFWVNESGMIFCLDAKDGSRIWRKRIRDEYWASPICANGKIYLCSKGRKSSRKGGKVSVISATRQFQLIAENEFDARFIASPAVAGSNLILRSLTHLYCFAEGH